MKNLLKQTNPIVKSVVAVGSVTGEKSPWNDTITGARVAGADLGIPVYDPKNERMLLIYGDTFSGQEKGKGAGFGDWRSNACAYSTHFDLAKGLKLDGWITREGEETATEIVSGMKVEGVEITCIPTGAIEIEGVIYVFYMSIRTWNGWLINYCGLTKSTDGGETYTKVDSVYFTGITDATTVTLLRKSFEEVKGHYAQGFCQVCPMRSGEYVYLYGTGFGRGSGAQLARVRATEIECFESYEYFTGYDAQGAPLFVSGEEGRKLANTEDHVSRVVMSGPVGELSVIHNRYLNKYITLYLRGNRLVFRSSPTPWGEWSEPIEILDYSVYDKLYCGFMHEKYVEQEGKVVYFMMSYWWDYESILMKLELY